VTTKIKRGWRWLSPLFVILSRKLSEDKKMFVPNNDGSLRMVIDDVFMIKGRGVVVTGRVEAGTVKKGDRVVIEGVGVSITTEVMGVEAFRKADFVAQAGDNVGLLLRDVTNDQIKAGMVVAAIASNG
jgi:translation elongation factor EF-Tu-like GTPase